MNAYDDLGALTVTEDFDWASVDRHVFAVTNQVVDSVDMAIECQRKVWSWVYQTPCTDTDGFVCRAIIACWVFVPELRDYTMTQMAGRFGKKKQSLGRWVADFKVEFPEITNHLQHIRNE